MKRIISAIAILLTAGTLGVGIQSPAHAGIGDGVPSQIVNVRYGECLTQVGSQPTDGTPIGHYPCDGSAAQLWTVDLVGNSTYRIRSMSSGMCVDVNQNGTSSGTILVQHPCNNLDQQHFFLISPTEGTYAFQSVWVLVRTGWTRVIDTPPFAQDYRVRLWSYNASTAQQWVIQ